MSNRSRRHIADINVVPFIDVMLVLLVIFMITAPLLSQGVKVDMPQAHSQPLATKDNIPLIVTVDEHGRYFLNTDAEPNKPISPQALLTHVAAELQLAKQRGKDRQVFVKGDKHVEYDKVVQAMVRLQQAGASSVGLMTQKVS